MAHASITIAFCTYLMIFDEARVFVIFVLALVCYGLTTVYLMWAVTQQKPIRKGMVLGQLLIGLLGHAVVLYPDIITQGGLNFNIFNVVSLTTLFILLFYWGFCLYRQILPLGILATPLAFLGMMIGFFGDAPYHPLSTISPILQAHIIMSLAAYSVLFMAAIAAIMLRLQISELKRQTFHRVWVDKLPSLQSMEALLFDMITVGFTLLSISLLLGFIDTTNLLAQHLVHKTVFSLLSWLVFGALLVGHWRFGWRGQRAANMTLYGVILLGLAFIGTKFVLELILNK